jgi:hypothetical protein
MGFDHQMDVFAGSPFLHRQYHFQIVIEVFADR